MNLRTFFAIIVITLATQFARAQQLPVTDKQPAMINGLQMGYNIKSAEEKEVSDKGNFSRYAVEFYVTNTTNEAKIILYKQGWNVLGNVSDQLAQFDCLNATGARFTSKLAIINAPACNVLALVDDKDANNKPVQNKRFVQIGYWIKAGQTIKTSAILIVPLNQLPDMRVTYLAAQLQPLANASPGTADYNQMQQQYAQPQDAIRPVPGFFKIRNVYDNSYLNTQSGTPQSTAIQPGWWSAQWQVDAVRGSRLAIFKNRWKENYLTILSGSAGLFVDYMTDNARWILEPAPAPNTFYIRNYGTGGYLCTSSNQLQFVNNYNSVPSAVWTFEQP